MLQHIHAQPRTLKSSQKATLPFLCKAKGVFPKTGLQRNTFSRHQNWYELKQYLARWHHSYHLHHSSSDICEMGWMPWPTGGWFLAFVFKLWPMAVLQLRCVWDRTLRTLLHAAIVVFFFANKKGYCILNSSCSWYWQSLNCLPLFRVIMQQPSMFPRPQNPLAIGGTV